MKSSISFSMNKLAYILISYGVYRIRSLSAYHLLCLFGMCVCVYFMLLNFLRISLSHFLFLFFILWIIKFYTSKFLMDLNKNLIFNSIFHSESVKISEEINSFVNLREREREKKYHSICLLASPCHDCCRFVLKMIISETLLNKSREKKIIKQLYAKCSITFHWNWIGLIYRQTSWIAHTFWASLMTRWNCIHQAPHFIHRIETFPTTWKPNQIEWPLWSWACFLKLQTSADFSCTVQSSGVHYRNLNTVFRRL